MPCDSQHCSLVFAVLQAETYHSPYRATGFGFSQRRLTASAGAAEPSGDPSCSCPYANSQGVLRVVPTRPPTVPAIKLLVNSPPLDCAGQRTRLGQSEAEWTCRRLGQDLLHGVDGAKVSTVPPPVPPERRLHALVQPVALDQPSSSARCPLGHTRGDRWSSASA